MSDDSEFGRRATDSLFSYIGRYVILFQGIESKIDQCLLFIWGEHINWTEGQYKLSRMRNQEKIDALAREVRRPNLLPSDVDPVAWKVYIDDLIARFHGEREYRNSLLHSQYIFDFLAIGAPIIQSDRRRAGDGAEFEARDLTGDLQDEAIARAIDLLLEAGMLQRKLIHSSYKTRQGRDLP